MNQEERDGYLGLLGEIQQAIKDGESNTRETRKLFQDLAERIEIVNIHAIEVAQNLIPEATPIAVNGRWHRSTPLKYMRTPLGTDGSRLHPARYHSKDSGGALYITNEAKTAAAERQLSVKKEIFVTFPLELNLQRVLDLTTKDSCKKAGVTQPLLGIEWQFVHDILEKKPYTQKIGDIARQNLFEAILFESVRLKGTLNLVVFPEVMQTDSFIKVYDPDGMLVKEHKCTPEALIISGILPAT